MSGGLGGKRWAERGRFLHQQGTFFFCAIFAQLIKAPGSNNFLYMKGVEVLSVPWALMKGSEGECGFLQWWAFPPIFSSGFAGSLPNLSAKRLRCIFFHE